VTLANDPNLATPRLWFGMFRIRLGHFDRGLSEIRRAHEFDPLSNEINGYLGIALFYPGIKKIQLSIFPGHRQKFFADISSGGVQRTDPRSAELGFIVADIADARVYWMCKYLRSLV